MLCFKTLFFSHLVHRLTQFYLLIFFPRWLETPRVSYVKFTFAWARLCSLCTVSWILHPCSYIRLRTYTAARTSLHRSLVILPVFKTFLAILSSPMSVRIIPESHLDFVKLLDTTERTDNFFIVNVNPVTFFFHVQSLCFFSTFLVSFILNISHFVLLLWMVFFFILSSHRDVDKLTFICVYSDRTLFLGSLRGVHSPSYSPGFSERSSYLSEATVTGHLLSISHPLLFPFGPFRWAERRGPFSRGRAVRICSYFDSMRPASVLEAKLPSLLSSFFLTILHIHGWKSRRKGGRKVNSKFFIS